jgi:hypothetical protein
MSLDLESPIMNMQIQINIISYNVILSVIELELKNITKKIHQNMVMYVNSRLFYYISQIYSSSMGKECLQPSRVILSKMRYICWMRILSSYEYKSYWHSPSLSSPLFLLH